MNLDLKNPTVQKVLLSILAGGALLGIFFMTSFIPFGYQNQKKAIDALRVDYDAKATELARAQATVRDLPRFEAEFEQLHERWAQTAELLPTDRQMPAVLRRLTLAAQQNGVQFVTFRPQPIRQQQNYAEMPVEVSVFGG
jgi:type IV pilus assembly protein PilO